MSVEIRKRRLVCGVGVNDADYKVTYMFEGKRHTCKFYYTWHNMLKRCYSGTLKERHPSYENAVCCEKWLLFSNFKAWMMTQDWEGKQLDKDLLFPQNKLYSPETCLFIACNLNKFLTIRQNDRGPWPVGVTFDKKFGKFRADRGTGKRGERCFLGYFDTPEEAHAAWAQSKIEQATQFAAEQHNPIVAEALINYFKGSFINWK